MRGDGVSSSVKRARPVQSPPSPRRMRTVRYGMSKQPRRTKYSKEGVPVGAANGCMRYPGTWMWPPPLAPFFPCFPSPCPFAGPPIFVSPPSSGVCLALPFSPDGQVLSNNSQGKQLRSTSGSEYERSLRHTYQWTQLPWGRRWQLYLCRRPQGTRRARHCP